MERIYCAETLIGEPSSAARHLWRDRRPWGGASQQKQGACAAVGVWSLLEFVLKHFAANPFPLLCLTVGQDQQHCLCLQADAVLGLIIEGTVQTASIKVDPHIPSPGGRSPTGVYIVQVSRVGNNRPPGPRWRLVCGLVMKTTSV